MHGEMWMRQRLIAVRARDVLPSTRSYASPSESHHAIASLQTSTTLKDGLSVCVCVMMMCGCVAESRVDCNK